MSRREITSEEFQEILEINEARPLSSIEDKASMDIKKSRSLILLGLLRNRVMTEVFTYLGLMNDSYTVYPETMNYLCETEDKGFSPTDIMTVLSEEIKKQKRIAPDAIELHTIFEEKILKMGLLNRISKKPGSYRANIYICQNNFAIPRKIAMNYLNEEPNAMKSACQSLRTFRDTYTGHRLPLINQCKSRLTIQLTNHGQKLWSYLKRYLFSPIETEEKIALFHQNCGDLVGFRGIFQNQRKTVHRIRGDIEFRIKEVNRSLYPPKHLNRYIKIVTGLKIRQEQKRTTKEGEYLYQRLDTTLNLLTSIKIHYNYLKQVRSWLDIIIERIRKQEDSINSYLRIFQSLRNVKEFNEKLEIFNVNVTRLKEREIEIPKIISLEEWVDSQKNLFDDEEVSPIVVMQFKNLMDKKDLISSMWVGRFIEVIKKTQDFLSKLESVIIELVEKGAINL